MWLLLVRRLNDRHHVVVVTGRKQQAEALDWPARLFERREYRAAIVARFRWILLEISSTCTESREVCVNVCD